MSILLKKSVSAIDKKDVDKELIKLQDIEQDIECSICQCVYTDPTMVNPCLHMYCNTCINDWSGRNNKCPKCNETIKGTKRQPDVVPLLELYQSLLNQEKVKVKKIKTLIEEREEMQHKINSLLDQNMSEPPKRPQTAKIRPEPGISVGSVKPSSPKFGAMMGFDSDSINCKICKHRPLSKPIEEYANIQFSPISLNGNTYSQNLLQAYLNNNGLTLDDIYKNVINDLEQIGAKSIHPDCKTINLKKSDSACDECLYEFAEDCIFYYAVVNKNLIDPSGLENCGAGAFCGSQYDENHAKSYNHFMHKY